MRNTIIQNGVIYSPESDQFLLENTESRVEKPGTVTITNTTVVFDEFVVRADSLQEACDVLHGWLDKRLEAHGF